MEDFEKLDKHFDDNLDENGRIRGLINDLSNIFITANFDCSELKAFRNAIDITAQINK